MAKITMSALVSDVRGKIGSQVFSSWKGRHYVKNLPTTLRNPISERQGKVRASLANSAVGWQTMPPETKLMWRQYAKEISSSSVHDIGTSNIIPKKGTLMSGFNAYTAVNTRLTNANLPTVNLPPTSTPPAILSASVANAYGLILIEATTGTGAEVGDIVRIFQKADYPKAITNIALTIAVTADDLNQDGSATVRGVLATQTVGGEHNIGQVSNCVYMGSTMTIQMNVMRKSGALSSPSTSFEVYLGENVSDERWNWIRTIWIDISSGFKADMTTYVGWLGLGAPDFMSATAAASYFTALFIYFFIAGEASMNFWHTNGYTKGALETAGCPMTVSEIVAAGLLAVPLNGDTDTLSEEW